MITNELWKHRNDLLKWFIDCEKKSENHNKKYNKKFKINICTKCGKIFL